MQNQPSLLRIIRSKSCNLFLFFLLGNSYFHTSFSRCFNRPSVAWVHCISYLSWMNESLSLSRFEYFIHGNQLAAHQTNEWINCICGWCGLSADWLFRLCKSKVRWNLIFHTHTHIINWFAGKKKRNTNHEHNSFNCWPFHWHQKPVTSIRCVIYWVYGHNTESFYLIVRITIQ